VKRHLPPLFIDTTRKDLPMSFSSPLSNALGANGPLESDVMPVLNHAAQQADGLLQRGADALRDNRDLLQDRAVRTQEQVNTYVREEPLKSLLMAAAAGAVLMGVVGLLVRGRSHHSH
jgi:ElaB/YqjD/DUF883 family membrane-anchored ribosome-binding protein